MSEPKHKEVTRTYLLREIVYVREYRSGMVEVEGDTSMTDQEWKDAANEMYCHGYVEMDCDDTDSYDSELEEIQFESEDISDRVCTEPVNPDRPPLDCDGDPIEDAEESDTEPEPDYDELAEMLGELRA